MSPTMFRAMLLMIMEFSLVSASATGFLLAYLVSRFPVFLVISYFCSSLIYFLGIKRGQWLLARGIGRQIKKLRKGD